MWLFTRNKLARKKFWKEFVAPTFIRNQWIQTEGNILLFSWKRLMNINPCIVYENWYHNLWIKFVLSSKIRSMDIKSILCKLNKLLIFYKKTDLSTAYTGITDLRLDISLCNQLNEHKFHGDVTILDLLWVQSYGVVSWYHIVLLLCLIDAQSNRYSKTI